jgi:hypothetical protein
MVTRFWRWLRREAVIEAAKREGYNKGTREAAVTLVEFTKVGGRIVLTNEAFLLNTVSLGLEWVIVQPETPAIFLGMEKTMYSVERRRVFDEKLGITQ